MIYFITYDINTNVKSYEAFYNAIKRMGESYRQPMENAWFVSTSDERTTANGIVSNLRHYIRQQDHLYVCRVDTASDFQGWLSGDFWNWYKDNLKNDKNTTTSPV